MSWNRIRQASLSARLLALLLPAMALVTAAGLWLTRLEVVQAANAAYDRSLLGAIKSLDLNVSTASGGLSVELPYRLFEFFQLTATGEVYFRVATDDERVEIGNPDLPPPPRPLRVGEPQFYDALYFNQPVRLGAYKRALERPIGPARHVVIQVAESTASRERFTASFVQQAAWRDALLLGLLLAAVAAVSVWALRPLRKLAAETRQRASDDLRPLDTAALPSDVVPVVDAINQQLARSAARDEQQRRFIDDASHQLRTPLTTLRAQVDYALREGDSVRARQALEALSQELDQTTRATNQLLALARSDAAMPQSETFDLGELAREVALGLLPQARAQGLDFGVEAPEAACAAQGDRGLLRDALGNLVHNAIVHGAPGGRITVEAAAQPEGWRLAVVDNGPGIEPQMRGRLGERFAKGRGSRGSGLGLAIARSAIEAQHGRLTLEPGSEGRGLRASLTWPRP